MFLLLSPANISTYSPGFQRRQDARVLAAHTPVCSMPGRRHYHDTLSQVALYTLTGQLHRRRVRAAAPPSGYIMSGSLEPSSFWYEWILLCFQQYPYIFFSQLVWCVIFTLIYCQCCITILSLRANSHENCLRKYFHIPIVDNLSIKSIYIFCSSVFDEFLFTLHFF